MFTPFHCVGSSLFLNFCKISLAVVMAMDLFATSYEIIGGLSVFTNLNYLSTVLHICPKPNVRSYCATIWYA